MDVKDVTGGHDLHTLLVEQGKAVKINLDAHPVLPFLEGATHVDTEHGKS